MKFLITSGGTVVPIDGVRKITNMSTGRFGSQLATSCLNNGHYVDFIMADRSFSPFDFHVDLSKSKEESEIHSALTEKYNFYIKNKDRINIYGFSTFESYVLAIETMYKNNNKYDFVLLSAAVSDYGVSGDNVNKKISSYQDRVSLELVKNPKIINTIREKFDESYLVGFKLLFNSSEDDLFEAMKNQINVSGVDACVGNDLREIRKGNHSVVILTKSGKVERFDNSEGNLAKNVISFIQEKP